MGRTLLPQGMHEKVLWVHAFALTNVNDAFAPQCHAQAAKSAQEGTVLLIIINSSEESARKPSGLHRGRNPEVQDQTPCALSPAIHARVIFGAILEPKATQNIIRKRKERAEARSSVVRVLIRSDQNEKDRPRSNEVAPAPAFASLSSTTPPTTEAPPPRS